MSPSLRAAGSSHQTNRPASLYVYIQRIFSLVDHHLLVLNAKIQFHFHPQNHQKLQLRHLQTDFYLLVSPRKEEITVDCKQLLNKYISYMMADFNILVKNCLSN